MSEEVQADRRIQKTLLALREAFFELVLSQSYDEIKVSDIIKKANVGRSTFYQHYKSKDDILAVSMHKPLSVLASTIQPEDCEEELLWLMEHFWQNRKFAPRIFAGNARRQVVKALAKMFETGLKKQCKSQSVNPVIPINLAAHQLAEAQLVIIIDWLLGKGSCSAKAMAKHIALTSKALSDCFLLGLTYDQHYNNHSP